jgi:hypothetical protein
MATIREWMIPSWKRTPVLVLSVYFLARLVYFAIYLDHSIPPDEVEHFAKTQVYGETLWVPERAASPASYVRATLGYEPGAYYLLAGKLAHLNVFGISDLLFLRLLSVLLGLGMVYVGWRFVERITENRIAQVLFVVMLTNTTMVVVTQSSVTYDALANLLGALALLLLLSFFIEKTAATLVGLLLCLALGTLTKTPMIPFAGFLILCLLFHERGKFRELGGLLRAHFSSRSPARWISIVILAVLILLNVGLYGRNLIKFGHFVPQPEQVLPFEQIMQSPAGSREYVVSRYQRGELSGPQAIQMADRITLPATRRDTRNLIDYYEHARAQGIEFHQFSRLTYAVGWTVNMLKSTYGILGHRVVYKKNPALIPYAVVFAAALVLFLFRWRPGSGSSDIYFLVIVLCYGLLLMQLIGYRAYSTFQMPTMAVQGRYMFPVLIPAYAFTAKYLLERRTRIQQFAIAAVVGFIFIEGDFFFCIRHARWSLLDNPVFQ